jgi:hypothetical protein
MQVVNFTFRSLYLPERITVLVEYEAAWTPDTVCCCVDSRPGSMQPVVLLLCRLRYKTNSTNLAVLVTALQVVMPCLVQVKVKWILYTP